MVQAGIDSKATATSYTTTEAPSTTEPVKKTKPKSINVLQINTVVGTDTAVTDAATSLRVNKDVLGVKGTEGIVKGVQDLSAISDTSGATNGQGSAKQSSGIVATSAVGTAGSSSGNRKGMTLSLAPLVPPADIYSGAGATDSTGKCISSFIITFKVKQLVFVFAKICTETKALKSLQSYYYDCASYHANSVSEVQI
jgi:hypothetical protein